MGRIPTKIIMSTTNENAEGTQVGCIPVTATLESTGVHNKIKELDYRGTRRKSCGV